MPGPLGFARLPSISRPLVALHGIGDDRFGKIPIKQINKRIRWLEDQDFGVLLPGYPPHSQGLIPGRAIDYAGRCSTVLETVTLIGQADLLLATESMAPRVGDLLDIPTLLILSIGDANAYHMHPSVHALPSEASCSPCYRLDRCPLGYSSCCRALEHESVCPERILEAIARMLQKV